MTEKLFKEEERIKKLNEFQKKIGITFTNYSLLNDAFTHSSFLGCKEAKMDNQRLEFLGDSVLSLFTTEYLYKNFPDYKEGKLTKLKNYLVSEPVLYQIALELDIGPYLLMSAAEEQNYGRTKSAALADALEALIGAVYLDKDKGCAFIFLQKILVPKIEPFIIEKDFITDYKSEVQYLVQKKYKICPQYEIIEKSGPNHDKHFVASFSIGETSYTTGKGKSKKLAEQDAAKKIWDAIQNGEITI